MSDIENDNQPFTSGDKRNNREYVEGEFESGAGPGGSPLVSGGYEVSKTNGPIQTRGINRKDQRYEQPEATLIANRQARALTEQSTSVICQGRTGVIEFRAPSGNNYDLNITGTQCDCPDFWRLRESGYEVALCKHCYIVQAAIAEVGTVNDLPWSTQKLAEVISSAVRTAEDLCRRGEISAMKVHNIWVIAYNSGVQDQIDTYMERRVMPDSETFTP